MKIDLSAFGIQLSKKPKRPGKWKPKRGTPLAPFAVQGNSEQASAETRYGGQLPITHVFFTTHEGGAWSQDEIAQRKRSKTRKRRKSRK
jgi:hypothetical protein